MSTTPWRGTLIFVGGIAAIAATAATRFAGADSAAPTLATGGSSGTSTSHGTSTGTSSSNGSSSTSGSTGANPAATSNAAPAQGGTVTVVGSTVQTPYGPLQLSVTFNGSKIQDVQALQYPSWHGESVRINQYAIPQLTQEAVAANSSNINGISGATFTSEAYVQSLQAAIDSHK
jgi:uncharacterized protein with FMN-binding domain